MNTIFIKKTISVAIRSALSLMALSAQSIQAAQYPNLDLSTAQGQSLNLDDVQVDYSSNGAAVNVKGSQNKLQGSGYEIQTTTGARESSVGLKAQYGGTIELSDVTITTGGSGIADGAEALGVGSQLRLKDAQISVSGSVSTGILTLAGQVQLSGGTIDIDSMRDAIFLLSDYQQVGGSAEVSDTQITAHRGNGVNAYGEATYASLDNVRITSLGYDSAAVTLSGSGSRVDVKNSTLQTKGDRALVIENVAGLFTMDGGSITTEGNNSFGLYTSFERGTSGAESDVKRVLIETTGEAGVGALARFSGSKIILSDSQIRTHGYLAFGLATDIEGASIGLIDSDIQTAGDKAFGLSISNQASAQIQGSTLSTQGTESHGIRSYGHDSEFVNDVELNNTQIQTRDGAGIMLESAGLIARLTDSSLIGRSAAGSGKALWINYIGYGTKPEALTLDAVRSQLQGDIQVDAGRLQLSMADHSSLDGAFKNSVHSAALNIDDSSIWTVRGDSTLNQLHNSGTVEFAAPEQTGAFKQLQVVGDLSGNGHYLMNTDLGQQRGDRLLVGGQVLGNNDILVRNSGAEPSAQGQRLTLVQSAGGPGSFSLANRGAVVDVGTYRYVLQGNAQSGEWGLVNVGAAEPAPEVKPEPTPEPTLQIKPEPNPEIKTDPAPEPIPESKPDPIPLLATAPKPRPENLSTAASAAINSSAIATLRATWDAERATLVQRVGDLRQGASQQGLWIRQFGQKQSLNNGVARDFTQQVQGTQLGIDTRIPSTNGEWVVGALAGYSKTDRDFKSEGSGKLDSYHVGGYATYLDDSGWYTDSVLTLNRWSNRLNVWGSDGAKVAGHSRSKGAGLSLEVGKQIALDKHWFVEPQAQVSVLYAHSDSYRLDNGLHVQPGDGLSSQARLGGRVGRKLELDNGTHLQPYLKAGWIDDISVQNKVRTNGIVSRPDGSGNAWYAGAGITAELRGKHQVYAEVETSEGSSIDRPGAANIGYRLSF